MFRLVKNCNLCITHTISNSGAKLCVELWLLRATQTIHNELIRQTAFLFLFFLIFFSENQSTTPPNKPLVDLLNEPSLVPPFPPLFLPFLFSPFRSLSSSSLRVSIPCNDVRLQRQASACKSDVIWLPCLSRTVVLLLWINTHLGHLILYEQHPHWVSRPGSCHDQCYLRSWWEDVG